MEATLEKLQHLWPEITMMIGACLCLIAGLSSKAAVRKATPGVAIATLVVSPQLATTTATSAQTTVSPYPGARFSCVWTSAAKTSAATSAISAQPSEPKASPKPAPARPMDTKLAAVSQPA